MPLSRRDLMAGFLAAPAILRATTGYAKAPLAAAPVPSIYRVKVGDIEVTAVHDGMFRLPANLFFADTATVQQVAAAASYPDPMPIPIMTFLVNTGDKLALIDGGFGKAGGPISGRLVQHLAAAGVTPADIDVVLLTHAHPDHIAGLVGDQGKPLFPNAELIAAETERKFWFDDGFMSQAPAEAKALFQFARDGFAPYAARTTLIGDGKEVLPGIRAEAAPGHTPGHTMFRISSGSSQLLVFGDIVHSAVLQFPHPEWSLAFDSDPTQARITRARVLDMVSADKLVFAGAHVPFPSIGTVVKQGSGYAYAPTIWRVDL